MLGGEGGGGIIGNSAYLGHIIHVINAAQQAGIVVGRRRSGTTSTATSNVAQCQEQQQQQQQQYGIP
eukprot:9806261-Ditylum_brightwellii.AAC.1